MALSFLKSVVVTKNETKVRKAGGPAKKDRNPIDGDLRIFKNGTVFPSQSFADKFKLEYKNKDSEDQGFAIDWIDSRRFGNTQQSEVPFLMMAIVSRSLPKVDLFGQVGFYAAGDETPEGKKIGDPINSVMSQGAASGKDLLEVIAEVYGVDIKAENFDFVDLSMVEGSDLTEALATATNGVYYLPKKISRGDKAGSWTVVKRENIAINPLVLTSSLNEEVAMKEVAMEMQQEEMQDEAAEDMGDIADAAWMKENAKIV